MSREKVSKESCRAARPVCRWAGVLAVALVLVFTAQRLWAVSFSQTRMIIEINATAGDAGIQIFVDAEGWSKLEIFDANGRQVLDISATGGVGLQGVTELFFESAEPSFEEQSLAELFARFPEGNYTFAGITVEGRKLTGKATFQHNVPDGPVIVSPAERSAPLSPNLPVVIDWQPVTHPFPGTTRPVTIVGYQVIVERVKPQSLRVFSAILPATTTQLTVSPEFIEPNADYNFEVLAIEASGNQTISEGSFSTAR